MREARIRRDLIAGELAAGRNPADILTAPVEPARARTLADWATEYRASRLDVAAGTVRILNAHLGRILPGLGERDPASLTVADVQAWVVGAAAELKPRSVACYMTTFRLLLDFAGVDPNPARDKRVKLPTIDQEEPVPPTGNQFATILEEVRVPLRRLALVLMEQTAMTVGEIETLAWGDVDVAESKIRLRRRNVKGKRTARARSPQVPVWLMDRIADTCPLEDRTADRRVFPGCTTGALQNMMARACKNAGIPHFTPHDLRHRRLTRWHHDGVPARVLAERGGHSRPSTTLDVYSHVLDPGEVPAGQLEALLDA